MVLESFLFLLVWLLFRVISHSETLSQFHNSIMIQVTIPHNWSYSQVSSRLTIFPFSTLAFLLLYKIQRRDPQQEGMQKGARSYNFFLFLD